MAVGQPVQGIPAQGLPSLQPSADGSVPAHGGMQGYVTQHPSMGVASSSGLNLLPLSPSGVSVLASPLLPKPEQSVLLNLCQSLVWRSDRSCRGAHLFLVSRMGWECVRLFSAGVSALLPICSGHPIVSQQQSSNVLAYLTVMLCSTMPPAKSRTVVPSVMQYTRA